MLEHRLEARYEQSMSAVFAALVRELGSERWLQDAEPGNDKRLPRTGLRFGYRQKQRLCFGQVLECIRPVSIVLVERYQGPAGCITARQRWRLDPLESATRLSAELRIRTNRFARLQLRFWGTHFRIRAQRTCNHIGVSLRHSCNAQSGSTGQSSGNITIVSANTTNVKGRPILR